MFDFEKITGFLKDLWRAMLDHWVITLFVLIFVFNVVSPPILIAFAIFKLVDVSRQEHKYDD